MTITKLPPLVEALYLAHSIEQVFREYKGYSRLLLRPHGRHAQPIWGHYNGHYYYWVREVTGGEKRHSTRAQAAQAVWEGRKGRVRHWGHEERANVIRKLAGLKPWKWWNWSRDAE